jgi:hypothetical protein
MIYTLSLFRFLFMPFYTFCFTTPASQSRLLMVPSDRTLAEDLPLLGHALPHVLRTANWWRQTGGMDIIVFYTFWW